MKNTSSRKPLSPSGFLGPLLSLPYKLTTGSVALPVWHNISVGCGVCHPPRMTTKDTEKGLDTTVRHCIIVVDCSGRRKSIEADGDMEGPVTCKVVMPLGKTVSG